MISFKRFNFNVLLCFTGLPLQYDIEGPSVGSEVVFVLGARPVTGGYDLGFAGQIAAAVFAPNRAPVMFSGCVLSCLESLTLDVAGTPLTITPFNVSSRELQLLGPASPAQVQQVLRSAVYLNRAPNLNVDLIQLQVFINQYAYDYDSLTCLSVSVCLSVCLAL